MSTSKINDIRNWFIEAIKLIMSTNMNEKITIDHPTNAFNNGLFKSEQIFDKIKSWQ